MSITTGMIVRALASYGDTGLRTEARRYSGGRLLPAVNSDLPGQITGQVRESVYDSDTGDQLLIPQGTRLVATAPISRRFSSAVLLGTARAAATVKPYRPGS
jgi:type F conjugative transfer system protein TrbI